MSAGGLAGAAVGLVRAEARRRALSLRRELTRPWREGRPGAPAALGRWLGLALAVGAAAAGVTAAVYAEWPRR